jgi:hypothetical protein
MSPMTVTPDDIRSAFLPAVRPAVAEIAPHDCDECSDIRTFFSAQPQFDVPTDELQLRTAALSLFGDLAFVYWLPAFMLAELRNADGSSDDFADWIAWKFLPRRDEGERTNLLSAVQARVVADFLDECAKRYPKPEDSTDFKAAAERVRHRLEGRTATT